MQSPSMRWEMGLIYNINKSIFFTDFHEIFSGNSFLQVKKVNPLSQQRGLL